MSLCVSVCLSRLCHQGNFPQYLSHMKSDLHETFSVFSDWSPELIDNVPLHANACVQAQCVTNRQTHTET